ncbi:MAG TPA: protoporphyrinogen oxidase, partial [Thermomicrobiales bacterium]|nr:protoporphyrinogen oxidase [Thermomicrobiales bacterium]
MSDAAKRGDGPRVVVIGGGIAGLAAAHRLTRLASEATITLVEAADRLGGKILTERRDGFIIEAGPEALLTAKPHGLVLCRELGLDERLLEPNAAPRRTFIRRDGRLHPMPEGLTGLAPTRLAPIVRTRLLSPVGKARVALEWLLPPRRDAADETLGDFIERRLGREFFDRLVAPLVGGVYGGVARPLSLTAAFPQLRQAEQTYGGLARAALARRPQPGGGRPASFVTPRTGLTEV